MAKEEKRVGGNIASVLASIFHDSVFSSPAPASLSPASGNPVKKEQE